MIKTPRSIFRLFTGGVLAGCCLLIPSLVFPADMYRVSAKELVIRLGEACGGGGAEWTRTSGPSSVLVRNLGDRSYARLYETGNYEFSTSCCSTTNRSVESLASNRAPAARSRVSSLITSPDRVGFGRNTTGGAAANGYTVVTSLNDSGRGTLREALKESRPPMWITFADSIRGGTINLRESINVTARNITIDGAGSDITISVARSAQFPMLQFRGGNTIIHGITLDGNKSRSTGMMLREGNNYWVDHVTVKNFEYDDGISVGQPSREDTSASEITVSNYHSLNTNYSLLGGGDVSVRNYPPYLITIHSSILSAEDRNPKIKNHGTAHLFNNYIHSYRFSGSNAGANSVIYSQNNVFSALSANNPRNALSGPTNNGGSVGRVYSSDDVFLDRASYHGDVRVVSRSAMKLPYSYNLRSSSQVLDHVNANAGADYAQSGTSTAQKIPVAETVEEAAPAAPVVQASPVAQASPVQAPAAPTGGSCVRQVKSIDYVRRPAN